MSFILEPTKDSSHTPSRIPRPIERARRRHTSASDEAGDHCVGPCGRPTTPMQHQTMSTHTAARIPQRSDGIDTWSRGFHPHTFSFTCLRKNYDELYSIFIFKISFVTTQSLSKSFTWDNLTMLFSNSQNIISWILVTNTVKWYQSVGSRYALQIHSQPLRHIWNRRCSEII